MPATLLLLVETTLLLPGLGRLVLPRPAYEPALRRLPLHAQLEVELHLPGGTLRVPASVEELQRDEQTRPGLLLEADAVPDLPAGTEIRLPAEWAAIYGW
ncbi:hypothetical protein [Hymenobacter sp. B81]|uniref:hypothetical protein n=1 Tax=Hymenobacter sp. B81 TaxID=3344878 RepID=UPI0037DCA5DC